MTLDWRQLERFRRLMQPNIRTVNWKHDHMDHDPTDGRGPLRRTQDKAGLLTTKNSHHPFGYNRDKGVA